MSLILKAEGHDSPDSPVSRVRLDPSGEKWVVYIADIEIQGRRRSLWNKESIRVFPRAIATLRFSELRYLRIRVGRVRSSSLREGSQSVGLIFPLQALTSNSAILTANKMFNDYGFLTLSKLCSGDTFCHVGSKQIVPGETYEISDFYEDDTVVAILHQAVCGPQATSEDDFKNYVLNRLLTFVRSGLFLQLEEGPTRVRQSVRFEEKLQGQGYMRLRSFSPDFQRVRAFSCWIF